MGADLEKELKNFSKIKEQLEKNFKNLFDSMMLHNNLSEMAKNLAEGVIHRLQNLRHSDEKPKKKEKAKRPKKKSNDSAAKSSRVSSSVESTKKDLENKQKQIIEHIEEAKAFLEDLEDRVAKTNSSQSSGKASKKTTKKQ